MSQVGNLAAWLLEGALASGAGLAALSQGARIGTSSLRRQSQLLYARSDLRMLEIRGNVDKILASA